ncbi:hypothetical protein AMV262 [Betaentomopoxvirus amoorei]|uniref:AMV262 n=1 Tax=Amsacta moorei entomopoxvirus TaxID=28321 RepID=Q9EME4_AMEPV|nr:hypothetical protein AMV262 [Amsacta moorei entomopoxvirus]AAG02968.1 AMV262 [Amsacta moorei entomopoxvirus]
MTIIKQIYISDTKEKYNIYIYVDIKTKLSYFISNDILKILTESTDNIYKYCEKSDIFKWINIHNNIPSNISDETILINKNGLNNIISKLNNEKSNHFRKWLNDIDINIIIKNEIYSNGYIYLVTKSDYKLNNYYKLYSSYNINNLDKEYYIVISFQHHDIYTIYKKLCKILEKNNINNNLYYFKNFDCSKFKYIITQLICIEECI